MIVELMRLCNSEMAEVEFPVGQVEARLDPLTPVIEEAMRPFADVSEQLQSMCEVVAD